jgi:enoyl-ACP reductase-like protein
VLRGVPSEDAKRVGPDYLAAPLRLRHCHGSKLDADARSCGASYIRVSKGLARLPAAIVMVAGRYVALELAPHGITANLVAPATVAGTTVTEQLTPERLGQLGAATPMGRLVGPDEVAHTVAFLATEDSGFTTGHYLPVNGGLSMD